MSVSNNFAGPTWLLSSEGSMLTNISESLYGWVLGLQFFHHAWKLLLADTFGGHVSCAACLQNNLMDIGP